MKAIWISLLFVLLRSTVEGADYYVGPVATGTGLGNNASNLCGGFADSDCIPVAGDTVYICGAHLAELVVPASGTSASPIIYDGDCPGNTGSLDTSALSGAIEAIDITDRQWITVQNVTILGAERHGILAYSTLTPMRGIHIISNTIDNRAASHPTNVCHAVYFSGTGTHADSSVIGNIILGTSTDCASQDNNDGINVEKAVGPFLIALNETSGAHEGIDVSSGSYNMRIIGNLSHSNRTSGIKIHGATNCPIGLLAAGNRVYGNGDWGIIFQDTQNSQLMNNVIDHDGSFDGLRYELVNSCTHTGNTIGNNLITADYNAGVVRVATGTRAQFETNFINGNYLWQGQAQTVLIYFNADTANNVTEANFSTWQASHLKDANAAPNELVVDWSAYDYRPTSESALRLTGAPYAGCRDTRNRACPPDRPHIGAYQSTSGDPAAPRAARQ